MKILIALSQFATLTGSEMYIYELGRHLVGRGNSVTVAANLIGGVITERAIAAGVNVCNQHDIFSRRPFDIAHCNQGGPTEFILKALPDTPVVVTLHTEFPIESVVADPRISSYICIRDTIVQRVPAGANHCVIPNGIDMLRFRRVDRPPNERRRILFVGPKDGLRDRTIFLLRSSAFLDNAALTLVGECHDYAVGSWVSIKKPHWAIEEDVLACDETAGIMMGRTTIEGWAMGRPGWIFRVGANGTVYDYALHHPPADMRQYDIQVVADQILAVYEGAIG